MLPMYLAVKKFKSEEAWWWVGLGFFFFVGMTWAALGAPDDVEAGWRLLGIAIGLIGLGFAVHAAVRSGVRITEDVVTIVGPLRTVRIPRARVDHFELQQRLPYIAQAVEVNGTTHSICVIGVPMRDQDEKRRHFEWIVEQMNAALSG
jgi:hypothetical protein